MRPQEEHWLLRADRQSRRMTRQAIDQGRQHDDCTQTLAAASSAGTTTPTLHNTAITSLPEAGMKLERETNAVW